MLMNGILSRPFSGSHSPMVFRIHAGDQAVSARVLSAFFSVKKGSSRADFFELCLLKIHETY
jgi:hypothetical protein